MPTKIKDGFHILSHLDGTEDLRVETQRLDDCIVYLKENPSLGVNICKSLGYYKWDDLNFLEKCKHVKSVGIQDKITDIKGLYYLRELKELGGVQGFRHELDLNRFPFLEHFGASWHKNIIGLEKCTKLKVLILGGYNSETKDLSLLSGLESLCHFKLVRGRITSLRGIEHLPLIQMEFAYLPLLTDIRAVSNLASLEVLRFDCCKRISSFNPISQLKRLKRLNIDACGDIPSIDFLATLSELEHLSLVDTRVSDRNLEPLKRLDKLRHVGFIGKLKNYSPSADEIKKYIRAKQGDKASVAM